MVFFFGPGLAYGLFTSRMPPPKVQAGVAESEIGLVLLALGACGLAGLSFAPKLIERFSAKSVLISSNLFFMAGLIAMSFATSFATFAACASLLGLSIGAADVTMNVQGIEVERRYKKRALNTLHAGYNIGAASGAAAGSAFAALELGLDLNFTVPLVIYALMMIWAAPKLLVTTPAQAHSIGDAPQKAAKSSIPLIVWACGLLSMFCYISEGTVGEWGSLFLHQEKQAPEAAAALVFAAFSVCSVCCRLIADHLRNAWGDFAVSISGSLLALAGMFIVLSALSWTVCLAGYALMGVGLAPLVPIAFSRAGQVEGISTARATSLVSLLAYGGLLFAPPLLGVAAERYTLSVALCAVPVLLLGPAVLSFLFRKKA